MEIAAVFLHLRGRQVFLHIRYNANTIPLHLHRTQILVKGSPCTWINVIQIWWCSIQNRMHIVFKIGRLCRLDNISMQVWNSNPQTHLTHLTSFRSVLLFWSPTTKVFTLVPIKRTLEHHSRLWLMITLSQLSHQMITALAVVPYATNTVLSSGYQSCTYEKY